MISILGELIGRGSDGDVYKLEENKIIKFINKEKINFLAFFILLYLNSLYLTGAHQIEVNEKNIKIVQDQAQCDLADLLKSKKKLRFEDKIKYIRHVISGVYFLNSYNIIHGDIKPNNILLFNNILKLTDYGLARDCKFNKNSKKRKLYTINYRPPECNDFSYSLKSDIWALGCTIYEIYYGHKYFLIDGSGNLYHLACNDERKKENQYVNKIIKMMIKNNPEERISIDKVAEYFTIPLIKNKHNLFVKNLWFKEDPNFIKSVYSRDENDDEFCNEKVLKEIIEDYKFKIFNII
jgi:serine/threonine protein kinase